MKEFLLPDDEPWLNVTLSVKPSIPVPKVSESEVEKLFEIDVVAPADTCVPYPVVLAFPGGS